MANKEISVTIRARDYASAAFEKVRTTLNSIRDRTVNIRANTGTAQAAVQGIKDKLASIRDKVVNVKADTGTAQAAVQGIKEKLADIRDKVVKVSVDTSGAAGSIAGVKESLGGFDLKAAVATAALSVAGKAFSAAITVVENALSAGKAAFIDYNAQLEQTRVAFASMLGSEAQANAMIGNLQKFAAETPFEMPGIRDAAQQLLAFGYDADEIIPTLTALGNAASGLGKGDVGFGQLAFVFGQIRTTGKLMGNDVMQLAQLGVPVKDILAKNLGLTKEELANVGELGIDANTAIRALTDGMNERFPEMMKKQSETFEGVLSNIKDNIGQAFGLTGLPLFEEAKRVLLEIKNITDTMLTNAQSGKNLFAGILPDDLIAKVTAFGENVKKVFAGLAPALEPMLWGLSKVANVLLDVGSIALTALRPIVPLVSAIWSVVSAVIGVIAELLDSVLAGALTLETHVADAMDYIYSIIADQWNRIYSITADLWNSATEVVRDFCMAAIEFIAGLVAEIADVVSPIVDTFAAAFQAAADFVYNAMATAAGYVRDFIAVVDEAIASVKELAVVKAATSLGNGITAVMDWVGGAVEETRERGRVSLAMHGFGSRKTIDSGAPDDGIIIPYRTDAPPAKDDEGTWSGVSQESTGGTSAGRSGIDAAEREAQRLAERIERLTEKVQQSVASLAHDIIGEVGTTYEKGMDALHQKMEQMEAAIAEASAFGIDTTALRAKLDEYANIVKEKVTKAWREANEDIRQETALTWAEVRQDARAEAEAAYQIGVTRLAREKENRLKEVAMTKDSAEARVAVEQWAAAEMAKLDRQRIEALRAVNSKRIALMQEQGDLLGLRSYLQENGDAQQMDIDLAGQQELAKAYVKIWNDAHRSVASYLADAADVVYGTLSNSIEEFIRGTKSALNVFKDFASSILSMMAKIAAQRLAANIMGGLFGGGKAAAAVTGAAATMGATGKYSFPTGVSFSKGYARPSLLSVPAFAKGGIVTAPTLAMIGEGGVHEAVIPLNERNLSTLGGGGQGKAPTVVVNITNRTDSRVSVENKRFDASLRKMVLDIVVDGASRDVGGFKSNLKTALGR